MNNLKEIIKPTRTKIVFALVITIVHLILIFNLPSLGFSKILSSLTGTQLVFILGLNLVLNAIAYYLLLCGLLGIYNSIRKPIHYNTLMLSVFIVLIFNPFSLYQISKLLPKDNQPSIEKQQTVSCGQLVVSISEYSKAKNAGLMVGDIVTSVDGLKITNINDLIENSRKKRPGDITNLETNRGMFKVELVSDPNNDSPVLGIKFKDVICQ
jgi:membrane-associated protease RseP (regulator of RpoE activity)